MDIKKSLANLQEGIANFPRKFKTLSLGEKAAYGCILIGVILVSIALVLFII